MEHSKRSFLHSRDGSSRQRNELPDATAVIWHSAEQIRRIRMDREHVKGTAEKVKGSIKDTAGKAMGDKKMQTEGNADKAKGSARNVAGDIKDAVKQSSKS
jgi:uncharacterized protein YjbJ (UPF0337 family)